MLATCQMFKGLGVVVHFWDLWFRFKGLGFMIQVRV